MRPKLALMISPTSLAAFTVGIPSGNPLSGMTPMQPIRTQNAAPAPMMGGAITPPGGQVPAQMPTQILPRGSLLNLSV